MLASIFIGLSIFLGSILFGVLVYRLFF